MKKMLCQIIFLLIISVPTPSVATVFTSEELFQVAAQGYVLENFDSFSEGTVVGELTDLGITFTNQGEGLPEIWSYANGWGASPKSQPNSLLNRPTNVLSTQPYKFSATNGELITAVGLWNIGTDDNIVLEFFDDQNVLIEAHLISQGSATFGGIVNFSGASTVVIRHGGKGNGFMGIDDLQVALAVPAPCEINDSDNDGVIDQWDKCPDTPAKSYVNNNGCHANDKSAISGRILNKGKPLTQGSVMLIQSGELFQKSTFDSNGYFKFDKSAEDKSLNIMIRKPID